MPIRALSQGSGAAQTEIAYSSIEAARSAAVHIHLCAPDHLTGGVVSQLWDRLSIEERTHADGLNREHDRQSYVCAHGLLRTVLARETGSKPEHLTFDTGPHGCPRLAGSGADVHFSLSHTSALVGCAVSRSYALGFDLEAHREPAPMEIALRKFSSLERSGLGCLSAQQQVDRFYALWTLKEAYLKSRGLGLTVPLRSFSVIFGERSLSLEPCSDDPLGATLGWWRLPAHHVALAVRGAPSLPAVAFHEHTFVN